VIIRGRGKDEFSSSAITIRVRIHPLDSAGVTAPNSQPPIPQLLKKLVVMTDSYVRNGLVALSWPIVLVGPCPLMIVTSSAKGSSLSRIDFNNCR